MATFEYRISVTPEQAEVFAAGLMFVSLCMMRTAMLVKKQNGSSDPHMLPLMLGTLNCLNAYNSLLKINRNDI